MLSAALPATLARRSAPTQVVGAAIRCARCAPGGSRAKLGPVRTAGSSNAELAALPSTMSENEPNLTKQAKIKPWDSSEARIGDGAGVLEAILSAAIALPTEGGAG